MVTLFYCDPEGWPIIETFKSEKKADKWVKKNLTGDDSIFEWYNPTPILVREDHTNKEYDGFRYC